MLKGQKALQSPYRAGQPLPPRIAMLRSASVRVATSSRANTSQKSACWRPAQGIVKDEDSTTVSNTVTGVRTVVAARTQTYNCALLSLCVLKASPAIRIHHYIQSHAATGMRIVVAARRQIHERGLLSLCMSKSQPRHRHPSLQQHHKRA